MNNNNDNKEKIKQDFVCLRFCQVVAFAIRISFFSEMHSLIDYRAKCALSSLQFQFYNDEEILKLSVKEITNSQSLDRLLNPIPNGLYDLALGPLDKNDVCMTCGMDYLTCPGHIGHIGLILPVFNPVLFKELIRLLRSSCSTCNTLLTSKLEKDYFYALMTVINKGLSNETSRIHDLYTTIVNNTDKALLDTLSFRDQFDSLLANIVSESVDNHVQANDTSIRNLLTEKFEILKNFCDVKLKQNRKQCPNCNIPLRVLRAEHSSKLFYAKGVSKRQMKKTKLNKPAVFDQQGDQQEPDVDIDNDELNDNIQKLALTDDEKLETLTGQAYLTPIDARKQIENLIRNEKEILNFMLGYTNDPNSYDLLSALFFNYIVVPPSKFRPISQYKDQKFENSQTVQLSKLLQQNIALKELLNELTAGTDTNDGINPTKTEDNKRTKDTVRIQEKLQNSWVNIQTIVNTLYDSDLDKINTDTPNGLKQVLERKEGLFRKHMMGKRVNYAGRSVISPDVYIGTDEIGIPEVFARKLTYPQPVNSINFWEMRQMVLNGPDVYPGATYVQYGNGTMIKLKGRDYESRLAIAKQLLTPESSIDSNLDIKIVHRHLKNGDILLFNRQPTLHRPSVMAHKARVLPNEKTLRMHYSNCKAYNADFDGDEMNIHLPQNEIARAEAYGLIAASEHYLVPKDGTPLGGLIHDHIVGGVALTIRGRYFNRNDYQYLVYNAFGNVNGKMKFLPPAILKPTRLWTGKQVISTLLLNLLPHHQTHLNLEGKSKVSEKVKVI
jgi:DNA-directed RNA polymerase I subunit RPA1